MLTRQLADLQYKVESPSLYLLDMNGVDQSVCIAYEGLRRWVVFLDNEWFPQPFHSKEEAAEFINYSFKDVVRLFDFQ